MIQLTSMTEVKVATDGRNFYGINAIDSNNPFGKPVGRNIWQQFTEKSSPSAAYNDSNPQWKGGDPKMIKPLIGKSVEGRIVTKSTPEIEAYSIDGREVTSYTTIVFAHESEKAAFKAAGHPLVEASNATETPKSVAPVVVEAF